MPSLCDVNVLLALCCEDHTQHKPALRWLDTINDSASILVCRVTQLSLMRLLNTPSAMLGKPHTVAQVWRDYDMLMADQRFIFAHEPSRLDSILRANMSGHLVSPKLWQDAYLAAFALAVGLTLVSFDVGFRQFKKLDLNLLS